MPGMSGRELAERLLAAALGHARALHLGLHRRDHRPHGVLGPGVGFLQKPFTLEALVRKVRETLDAAVHPGAA